MYPTLALISPNITKVIEAAALLKKRFQWECICSDLQVGTKKNRFSMMQKIPGRNIWNETIIRIHSSTVKGRKDIWHPKHTEVSWKKSQGRSRIWIFGSFGLQPQRYQHLQGLRCIEMNNINGYNKTKQKNKESTFITSKNLLSVLKSIVEFDLEKIFNLIFKLWEKPQALLTFTQSGFEALSMIKCCLQPTQSSLLLKKVPLSIFETFATSFTRSFTRFFASKQFWISS